MKLTPEQQTNLIKKLQQPGWATTCQICKTGVWNISDTIFELREFQGGNLVVGWNTQVYPIIPISCSGCGNTIFLNAVVMGIIEPGVK